jgi:hypothetical protein
MVANTVPNQWAKSADSYPESEEIMYILSITEYFSKRQNILIINFIKAHNNYLSSFYWTRLSTFNNLCKEIIYTDDKIRFAGIANFEAHILAARFREGIEPLLTTQESELSLMQSLIRMSMRRMLESKLGRPIYVFAEYEKIKRATFAIYNEQFIEPDVILKVSFDKTADAYSIIEEKIKPLLKRVDKSLNTQSQDGLL